MKYQILLLCLAGVLPNAHAKRPTKIMSNETFVNTEVIKKMFNETSRVSESANGIVSTRSIGEFKICLDRVKLIRLMQDVCYTAPAPRTKRFLDDHTEILSEKKQVRYS